MNPLLAARRDCAEAFAEAFAEPFVDPSGRPAPDTVPALRAHLAPALDAALRAGTTTEVALPASAGVAPARVRAFPIRVAGEDGVCDIVGVGLVLRDSVRDRDA